MSVRPGGGWFEATRLPSGMTGCISFVVRRQRVVGVVRWEHADWVDRHRRKMCTASPLMRGLDQCCGEFSLMALGCNFRRMVNELGVDAFREHCLPRRRTPVSGV